MDRSREVVLDDLPIINKAMMMEKFDRFVTDPRLKLADLQTHVRQITRDEYYLGEYRVFTTSGSSGQKGVFVSNRREWSTALAGYFRCAVCKFVVCFLFPLIIDYQPASGKIARSHLQFRGIDSMTGPMLSKIPGKPE